MPANLTQHRFFSKVLCAKNRYAFQTIYITNAAKGCDSVSRSLAAYLFGLLWLTVISGSPSA